MGTGNATNKEASEIVYAKTSKKLIRSYNVEIILSELINREDNTTVKTTVQEANRLL